MASTILWVGVGVGVLIFLIVIGVIVYLLIRKRSSSTSSSGASLVNNGFPTSPFVLKYNNPATSGINGQCINPNGGNAGRGVPIVLYNNCPNPPPRIQFNALSNGALQNVANTQYCLSSGLEFEPDCSSTTTQFQLLSNGQLYNVVTGQCVTPIGSPSGGNTTLSPVPCSKAQGTFTASTS